MSQAAHHRLERLCHPRAVLSRVADGVPMEVFVPGAVRRRHRHRGLRRVEHLDVALCLKSHVGLERRLGVGTEAVDDTPGLAEEFSCPADPLASVLNTTVSRLAIGAVVVRVEEVPDEAQAVQRGALSGEGA